MTFSSIPEIVDELRRGRMVVIVDDEDRENEGDLVMAASRARPEDINFMARYGRGLICLTLTRERCERLRLPLMVSGTHAKHATNFTVSIEAAEGVTTGISAAARATTVQAAVAPAARAEDLVQPGHTVAGGDRARLAGYEAAAVIVEILIEDGSMARRPELERFAAEHGLKMGTIADLIHYRLQNEKTVERLGTCALPTEHGEFRLHAFRDSVGGDTHYAVVKGEVRPDAPALVRVHMLDNLSDLFGAARSDALWSLREALARISREGQGGVVVLRQPHETRGLLARMREYQMQVQGLTPVAPPANDDLRTYGVGAQILAELGVGKMRVLGPPKRLHGLAGFGLEEVEYVGDE